MKRVVIKLSGKVFDNPTRALLEEYASLFVNLLKDGIQSIVIAGGGPIARLYIKIARELGYDEASLDQIGIIISRLNARLLLAALKDNAYPKVPEDLDEILIAALSNKVIVTGGLQVGQSTNATAALIAEKVKAELFINTTDVEGIYSSDPRKDKSARLLNNVTVKQIRELLIDESSAAGEYDLMDIVALKIIERSSIRTHIIFADPKIIDLVARGKDKDIGSKIII